MKNSTWKRLEKKLKDKLVIDLFAQGLSLNVKPTIF